MGSRESESIRKSKDDVGSRKKGTKKSEGLTASMVILPCPHPPGSEGKVLWMAARIQFNLPLHVQGDHSIPIHPHDRDKKNWRDHHNKPIEPENDYEDEL